MSKVRLPVAINMKIALNDTTLLTGGGPSGTEPLGILKGTQVGESIICSFHFTISNALLPTPSPST